MYGSGVMIVSDCILLMGGRRGRLYHADQVRMSPPLRALKQAEAQPSTSSQAIIHLPEHSTGRIIHG